MELQSNSPDEIRPENDESLATTKQSTANYHSKKASLGNSLPASASTVDKCGTGFLNGKNVPIDKPFALHMNSKQKSHTSPDPEEHSSSSEGNFRESIPRERAMPDTGFKRIVPENCDDDEEAKFQTPVGSIKLGNGLRSVSHTANVGKTPQPPIGSPISALKLPSDSN